MMLFLKLKHPLMLFAAAQELEEAKSESHFSRYSAKGTASRSSLLVLPHDSKLKYPLMLCVPQQLEEAKSGVPL